MWPQYILDQFSRISKTDIANDYFGAYLSILAHECFSDSQTFAIHPQYPLPGAQDPGVSLEDYIVTFVVTAEDSPVFFIQIDAPRCDKILTDQRMYDRFRCFYNHGLIRIPKLHGISSVGEGLAFYSLDGASGDVVAHDQYPESPGSTESSSPDWDQNAIQDAVVRAQWQVDITTEEGQDEFMSVIDEIKKMVLGSVMRKRSNKDQSRPTEIYSSTARSSLLSEIGTPLWPQYICDQFSRVLHNNTLENHYLGVYLSILVRECFSDPQKFMVHPHYAHPLADDSPSFNEYVLSYVVWAGDVPVFMIDIKPQSHLPFQRSRVIANEDMQRKRKVMLDFANIKIHCVSAMGKRLSFYSVDAPSRRFSPEDVNSPKIGDLTDVVPESRWDVDITTQAGYQKFMTVVDDVKRAVEEFREKNGGDSLLKRTSMRIRQRQELRELRERWERGELA